MNETVLLVLLVASPILFLGMIFGITFIIFMAKGGCKDHTPVSPRDRRNHPNPKWR